MKSQLIQRFGGNLRGDLFGGVTAAIVALPLALGFGVASGLDNGAAAGLYGAIAVGVLAAMFGGTPSQISGPTGPMTVVVAGLAAQLTGDPAWVFAMVALSGVVQIVLGLVRVGRFIHYIPYPVVSGFMTGIGVIIIILQLSVLFGNDPASSVLGALGQLPEHVQRIDPTALGLGLATIALVYLAPLLTKAIPGTLAALVCVTLVSVVGGFEVPRIGEIPSGLPSVSMPAFELDKLLMIVGPAIALGTVGALDSLLTSLVADNITRTRHDSERELIGQGIGNVAAGMIGGLPGAGATMRTVVNVRSGGRSHLSGVVHGLLLLAILMSLGPVAARIPMSVLAGILITVGIGIVDTRGLSQLLKVPRGDAAVMLAVLALTVFVDLMWAVGIGVVMASLLLLKRMSDLTPATHACAADIADHPTHGPSLEAPREVLDRVYLTEVQGSLFFGNAGPLRRHLESIPQQADAVVLDMSAVRFLDQSAAYAIVEVATDLRDRGVTLHLAALDEGPAHVLAKLRVAPGAVAADQVWPDVGAALRAAVQGLHAAKADAAARRKKGREVSAG